MGAHHHASPAHRWRLAVAFAITTAVLLAEVAGALITGSLALLVDAAHMLTDAGGLLMALLASTLMARPPTARRTWGSCAPRCWPPWPRPPSCWPWVSTPSSRACSDCSPRPR